MAKSSDRGFARIEGAPQLARLIGKVEPGLRKELGQRNKAIGQRIIDKAFPKPESVGSGPGAKPRASASTTTLRVFAGGSHRKHAVQQWGRTPKPRDGVKRPYIRRAAEQEMDAVKKEYMDALMDVAEKAGLETKRT